MLLLSLSHFQTHTPIYKPTNAAHALFHIFTVGLITLLHYTLSTHPLLSSSLPCLVSFSTSSVYSTSDPWIIPGINCVWLLTLYPPPSSYPHSLFLNLTPFPFQFPNCHHQACRKKNKTDARRKYTQALYITQEGLPPFTVAKHGRKLSYNVVWTSSRLRVLTNTRSLKK